MPYERCRLCGHPPRYHWEHGCFVVVVVNDPHGVLPVPQRQERGCACLRDRETAETR